MADSQRRRVNIFDDSNLSQVSQRIHKRKKRNKTALLILSAALIAATLYLIAVVFFRIAVIEVVGTDVYTDTQITEAAGIKTGDKLLSLDRTKISENVRRKLTGIESVKVKITLPNKLTLTVSEGAPKYSFESGDKLYYLSENFIALGSELSISENDVIYNLQPNQIKKYVSGEKVVFYDKDWEQIIKDLTKSLEFCGLAEKVTLIETSDKFNIVVRYDGRIKIALGEYEYIDEKLEFAKSTIDSMEIDAMGTLRIKDYRKGSFNRGEY